jgi:hypothetical protein
MSVFDLLTESVTSRARSGGPAWRPGRRCAGPWPLPGVSEQQRALPERMLAPMPPSPEEQAAIKRRLRALGSPLGQRLLDLGPEPRLSVQRAAKASAPLKAPALSNQN